MKIDLIAGARPNFMKIAPIIHAIAASQKKGSKLQFRLVHTGQHYDRNMSGSFFEQLEIPMPDVNLETGSGTQAQQTSKIMLKYEKLLSKDKTDLCLVVGDVTSTMACAITAKKLHIPVAHVEAGIRSGDRTMPEEINRLVTDSISDYFFTTSTRATEQLISEGARKENIYFVGNTMIDTLMRHRKDFKKPSFWDDLQLEQGKYLVMTLHRPNNVDEEMHLKKLLLTILENTREYPLVFPVHPRTKKVLDQLGIENSRLNFTDPLGYLEFNYLVSNAKAVITDSGGITEETTVMGIPCMTLRDSTERPETVEEGTNELLGTNPEAIPEALNRLFSGNWKKGSIPELWDGKAAERIIKILQGI